MIATFVSLLAFYTWIKKDLKTADKNRLMIVGRSSYDQKFLSCILFMNNIVVVFLTSNNERLDIVDFSYLSCHLHVFIT